MKTHFEKTSQNVATLLLRALGPYLNQYKQCTKTTK